MIHGMNCNACRLQYAAANRSDRVPCDLDPNDCAFTPSPGDTGPDGCGLLPENEEALELHHRMRVLGPAALELSKLEFEDEDESEIFVDKLMLLAARQGEIEQAVGRRSSEKQEIKDHDKLKRRRNVPERGKQ